MLRARAAAAQSFSDPGWPLIENEDAVEWRKL